MRTSATYQHIGRRMLYTYTPNIYVIILCMNIWRLNTIPIWWPAFEPISCIMLFFEKNSSTYPLYSKLIRMWCAVNFSFWTLWLSAFMIRFLETFHPSQSNEFPVSLLRCCFLTLSRMNHSCFPNVVYMSDKRHLESADADVGHLQNNMCWALTPIISIW